MQLVYNPKALQREFVRPNSRRVDNKTSGVTMHAAPLSRREAPPAFIHPFLRHLTMMLTWAAIEAQYALTHTFREASQ